MQDHVSPASPFWRTSSPVQSFRFRTRTELIDWRRLAALDLDHVVRETDINLLQEFISTVTFCNVESERCPRCRCPIDMTLLKALRVSQLCTEYLLHCQEYLSEQVLKLEESLQGALSRAQHKEEERARLQKEMNEVKLESRRRKKLISIQQDLLQASAHNYHKCQYCEKCFINYSYLQSHVQRRHHQISDAEIQKMKQLEQMKDTIEDLRENLRVTENRLEAEREMETQRRQQELEEQRRRELTEKEAMEKWKEERQKSEEEVSELKQIFLQEFKRVANKSSFLEAKLHELESREHSISNLKSEDDHEKMQMRIRERELKEQMTHKKNVWKKKLKEVQNRLEHEKEELQNENERLLKALSMEESSSSSLHSLKQQVLSLSSQLRQKDTLIHSQKKKIKKLALRSFSEPPANTPAQNSAHEDEDNDDDEKEEYLESQWKFLESVRGNPKMMRNYRPIVDEKLQQKLEELGLKKGIMGISTQALRSLSSQLSTLRVQKFRSQAGICDLRENIETELSKRLKELQRKRGRSALSTHTQKRKKLQSPTMVLSTKSKQVRSKPSTKKPETLQPPKALPRSIVPPRTGKAGEKKNSTPPFSSEEEDEEEEDGEELGEDSSYITSPQPKVTSLHLTSTEEQQKVESDWSDSDGSNTSNTKRIQEAQSTHGSVVQTLTRSLEKRLSSSITKLAGGIQMLPPSSERSTRPTIIKQQAVSEEESDLDLSSIEELIARPDAGRVSLDVVTTSGTSVWSSGASRPGAWSTVTRQPQGGMTDAKLFKPMPIQSQSPITWTD